MSFLVEALPAARICHKPAFIKSVTTTQFDCTMVLIDTFV
jgi:hypothetical protein